MERMTTMRRLALIVCAGASLCVRGGQSIEATAAFGSEHGMTMTHTSLASGQVIRTWNEICRSQAFGNNLRNARQLAIMHTAIHDAVNGVEARYERHLSSLSDPNANAEAAAAAAAHTVLVNFFPANQVNLDAALTTSLANIPDGPAKDTGVALGAAVGQEAFDARVNDGFSAVDPFQPPLGPGFWKPTPPTFAPMVEPQFQNVRTFGINSNDQFTVEPKEFMILTSENYAQEFNEVKEVGQDHQHDENCRRDSLRPLLVRGLAARLEQDCQYRVGRQQLRSAHDRTAARAGEHGHGGRVHIRLVLEAGPCVLASDYCDPRRRHRRQSGDDRRRRLEFAPPVPSNPRLPIDP